MPHPTVTYQRKDNVAIIRIDDGKRNALSPEVFSELYGAFARAESEGAIVILTGRETVFSAGFDLKVMQRGGVATLRMLNAGFALTARVMAYPYPVIAACNGHSLAMGVFLMLSADHVIACRGDFRIAANEVALGLTMPRVAVATLRHRLTPAAFQRAVTLSNDFDVESARDAGIFDELVEPDELLTRAHTRAGEFAQLDMHAHAASKLRIRRHVIRTIRRSIPFDLLDAIALGLRRARQAKKRS